MGRESLITREHLRRVRVRVLPDAELTRAGTFQATDKVEDIIAPRHRRGIVDNGRNLRGKNFGAFVVGQRKKLLFGQVKRDQIAVKFAAQEL